MSQQTPSDAASKPLSPCISICELDEAAGMCLGCGRTVEEISNWLKLDAVARDAVWSELPTRLKNLKKANLNSSIDRVNSAED